MIILFLQFISLVLLVPFTHNQICSTNNNNNNTKVLFPLDISNISNTVFENVNIYSNPPPYNNTNQTINITIHKGNNILSLISPGYGSITLDRNIDFLYGDQDSKFEYNCTNISLISPSINLFWGSQRTLAEIIIECILVNKSDVIGGALFKDNMLLTFPVVQFNISDDDTNQFIYDFISNVNDVADIESFQYTVNNFSFESHFFNIDDFNQESQFYFLNGNNPINCNNSNEVTFIFYNDFIKISNEMNTKLQDIITQLNIKSKITEYYANKDNSSYSNIVFYRNFYYNEFINEFEQMLMNTDIILDLNKGLYLYNTSFVFYMFIYMLLFI